MSASAVRPLRTAIVQALKAANTSAGARVYTPPVPQGGGTPHILIDGYAEDPSNFFGRSGSWVRCQVKGRAISTNGDAARESLWEEVYAALHRQPLTVTGHLLLNGVLRRTATFLDPDGKTLHFVGTYEGTTREA